MSGHQRTRGTGLGAVVLGIVLVLVGGYYVLRNTLGMDLPQLDGDKLVPVLALLVGAVLLVRAYRERDDARRPTGRQL
jgi:hypothetical protein